MNRAVISKAIVILLLYCGPATAWATNRTVTSLGDSGTGTLREALNASGDGDTIDFSVTGVITLQSALTIANSIAIHGPGSAQLTLTGGNSNNFFFPFIIDNGTANEPTVILTGLKIANSTGGIYNKSSLTVDSCIFSGNATNYGVAISNAGPLTVLNCAFTGNRAAQGGAILNSGTVVTVTISNCTFTGNSTVNYTGGAIDNGIATLVVLNCAFTSNHAASVGGAIYSGGIVTMSNCTLSNNSASSAGGSLYQNSDFADAAMTLRNCTLYKNSAATAGGIYNNGSNNNIARLTVSNCTLDGNSGTTSGGGIYNTGTSGGNAFVNLDNTILQAGAAGTNLTNVGFGTSISSDGYNLSSDGGGGFLTAAGDQINADPKLGPLQDNGGPTLTVALLPGSTAWDQGKNFGVTTDQRGLPRPFDAQTLPNPSGGDGSDIGAVEMQFAPAFVVNTTQDHDDGFCSPDDCTLREAINATNATAGQDVITFKSGLAGTILLSAGLGPLTVNDPVEIDGPGARVLAVSGNSAGRVFIFNAGQSAFSGLTIRDGADSSGGGVYIGSAVSLNVTDCAFISNKAKGADSTTAGGDGAAANGGAIINLGTVNVNRCTFSGNSVAGGKGANGVSGINTKVTGGAGGNAEGGAIFNASGASLSLVLSTFSGNTATGGTGGSSSSSFGGKGGDAAGGIFNNNGAIALIAVTLSGNTGVGGTGGTGNSRFNNGAAGSGSGALTVLGSGNSNDVRDTLSAGNIGTSGPDAAGTFSSAGYNLIGIGDSSTGFTAQGDQVGTTANPIVANLGILQNNGGQTDTFMPKANSPAIDAGNSFGFAEDQRTLVRILDDPNLTNAPGGDGSDIGAVEAPLTTPSSAQALNIATRMQVQGGNNVLIAGFIITGSAPKTVAVRGIGPSLAQFFSGTLADPTLELHGPAGFATIANDNWQDDPAQAAQLTAHGLALQDPNESGIVATLQPGLYSAILAGKNNGTGVGLVEVYDLDRAADSQLANISTRGFVQSGDNVMIGGFILGGNSGNTRIAIRGIGPSLAQFGLSPVLADPTLELHDVNGAPLLSDDWQNDPAQAAQLSANGLALSDPKEAGIFVSLPPGQYTAILAGKNGGTGIGLLEIYNVH